MYYGNNITHMGSPHIGPINYWPEEKKQKERKETMSEGIIREHNLQEQLEDAKERLMHQENLYAWEMVTDLEAHLRIQEDRIKQGDFKYLTQKPYELLLDQMEKAWKEYQSIEDDIQDEELLDRLQKIEGRLEDIAPE